MTERKVLNDVYVIRPLAIFLLVVWHSFIIYTGGWSEPQGFQPIECYWWLAKLSYAFMLELFVFISGYVFGLTLEKGRIVSFKSLLISKFYRLIIPSLIFSIFYYLFFYNLENFTVVGFVWSVLNGCGHMWFLPMLFWVTLMAFTLDKLQSPQWLKFVVAFCLPSMSLLPIPLGLSSAMYYLAFFYIGLVIYRKRTKIIEYLRNKLSISICLVVLFILLFICKTIIDRDVLSVYNESELLIVQGIAVLCKKYMRLLCAVSGVAFVYALVNYLIVGKRLSLPGWVVDLNGLCFGIYLFQQFILVFLYYKTSLPTTVGPYWLPWVALAVTLILSCALTKMCLKTKLGRKLI